MGAMGRTETGTKASDGRDATNGNNTGTGTGTTEQQNRSPENGVGGGREEERGATSDYTASSPRGSSDYSDDDGDGEDREGDGDGQADGGHDGANSSRKRAHKDLVEEHQALKEKLSSLQALVQRLEAGVAPLTSEERVELESLRNMQKQMNDLLGLQNISNSVPRKS